MELVIKNGTVVTAAGTFPADVLVKDGIIAAIGQDLTAPRVLDASQRLVIPGGVDIHTHLQYHVGDFDTADTFATGSRAAAFGGTTTVMDFVEALPDEPLASALERRRLQAQAGMCIDYSLHMSILPTDIGKLEQLPALIREGCPSFKHYLAYAFTLNDRELLQSFRAIAQAHGLAIVHAENWDLISELIAQALRQGHTHPRFHPLCRPALGEGQAVGKVIDLAYLSNVDLFLFHITCKEAVQRLIRAKERGQVVRGETCPHYTCLDSEIFEKLGPLPICAPPIRESEQSQYLIQALLNNSLDSVSTDHCPFTKAEKMQAESFNRVPGGMASIETRLMLIKNLPGMTCERWVESCCTSPARIMGLTHKGQIAPGYDADIVIWNPDLVHTLSVNTLHENVDWTPYEGRQVQGLPQTVLSRGEVIMDQGKFLAQPGRGRYQARYLH